MLNKNMTKPRSLLQCFLVLMFLCFLVITSATPALATDAGSINDKLKNVAEKGVGFLPNPSIPEFAGTIVYGALTLLGLIFFILVVYGGVLHLTAGGNDEQAKKSTKIIIRALIGLLIVIFAGAITQFIIKVAAPVQEACPSGQARNSEGICVTATLLNPFP